MKLSDTELVNAINSNRERRGWRCPYHTSLKDPEWRASIECLNKGNVKRKGRAQGKGKGAARAAGEGVGLEEDLAETDLGDGQGHEGDLPATHRGDGQGRQVDPAKTALGDDFRCRRPMTRTHKELFYKLFPNMEPLNPDPDPNHKPKPPGSLPRVYSWYLIDLLNSINDPSVMFEGYEQHEWLALTRCGHLADCLSCRRQFGSTDTLKKQVSQNPLWQEFKKRGLWKEERFKCSWPKAEEAMKPPSPSANIHSLGASAPLGSSTPIQTIADTAASTEQRTKAHNGERTCAPDGKNALHDGVDPDQDMDATPAIGTPCSDPASGSHSHPTPFPGQANAIAGGNIPLPWEQFYRGDEASLAADSSTPDTETPITLEQLIDCARKNAEENPLGMRSGNYMSKLMIIESQRERIGPNDQTLLGEDLVDNGDEPDTSAGHDSPDLHNFIRAWDPSPPRQATSEASLSSNSPFDLDLADQTSEMEFDDPPNRSNLRSSDHNSSPTDNDAFAPRPLASAARASHLVALKPLAGILPALQPLERRLQGLPPLTPSAPKIPVSSSAVEPPLHDIVPATGTPRQANPPLPAAAIASPSGQRSDGKRGRDPSSDVPRSYYVQRAREEAESDIYVQDVLSELAVRVAHMARQVTARCPIDKVKAILSMVQSELEDFVNLDVVRPFWDHTEYDERTFGIEDPNGRHDTAWAELDVGVKAFQRRDMRVQVNHQALLLQHLDHFASSTFRQQTPSARPPTSKARLEAATQAGASAEMLFARRDYGRLDAKSWNTALKIFMPESSRLPSNYEVDKIAEIIGAMRRTVSDNASQVRTGHSNIAEALQRLQPLVHTMSRVTGRSAVGLIEGILQLLMIIREEAQLLTRLLNEADYWRLRESIPALAAKPGMTIAPASFLFEACDATLSRIAAFSSQHTDYLDWLEARLELPTLAAWHAARPYKATKPSKQGFVKHMVDGFLKEILRPGRDSYKSYAFASRHKSQTTAWQTVKHDEDVAELLDRMRIT